MYAGTPTGYRHHIEKRRIDKRHRICQACREAIRVHHANYKKRRILSGAKAVRMEGKDRYTLVGGNVFVDSTGTQRRLKALATLGYGWGTLARKLGVTETNVGKTANAYRPIYPTTVEKIKALYDELSMLPPPEGRESKVTITRAKNKGWLPPLNWDDDTIDDPYGLPVGLTQAQEYNWFWNAATMTERIEWVLEHGLSVTRKR